MSLRALLRERLRHFGAAATLGHALTLPARKYVGLQLRIGLRATAADILSRAREPTIPLELAMIRGEQGLETVWPACTALNPNAGPLELRQLDRIAVARERGSERLIGYWCFLGCGTDLYDRNLFVGREMRGRGIAAALLRSAASELSPDSFVYAEAQLFNRPSLRALIRAGMRRYRAVVMCDIPGAGLRWTSEWERISRLR